eukprot:s118_g45.t1
MEVAIVEALGSAGLCSPKPTSALVPAVPEPNALPAPEWENVKEEASSWEKGPGPQETGTVQDDIEYIQSASDGEVDEPREAAARKRGRGPRNTQKKNQKRRRSNAQGKSRAHECCRVQLKSQEPAVDGYDLRLDSCCYAYNVVNGHALLVTRRLRRIFQVFWVSLQTFAPSIRFLQLSESDVALTSVLQDLPSLLGQGPSSARCRASVSDLIKKFDHGEGIVRTCNGQRKTSSPTWSCDGGVWRKTSAQHASPVMEEKEQLNEDSKSVFSDGSFYMGRFYTWWLPDVLGKYYLNGLWTKPQATLVKCFEGALKCFEGIEIE